MQNAGKLSGCDQWTQEQELLLYFRGRHQVHRAYRYLLRLLCKDLLSGCLLLNATAKPEYQLTQVFLLRGKHLEDTVLLFFVSSKERSDTLLVCFPRQIWVEVTHDLFTLTDGIDSSQEESKHRCVLINI